MICGRLFECYVRCDTFFLSTSHRHLDFTDRRTAHTVWLNNGHTNQSAFTASCKPRHEPRRANVQPDAVQTQVQRSLQGSSFLMPARLGDEIKILCSEGQLDKALDAMDEHDTVLTLEVYTVLLNACTKKKALVQAKRVHSHLAKHCLESTSYLGESVVVAFVRCGSLDDALQVFQRLPNRTVVAWTSVITGYSRARQGQEALRMYHRMREEGIQPNKQIFVSVLKACSSLLNLEEGKHIHAEALISGLDSDLVVATCLIDMYAKCGCIAEAEDVFHSMALRDVVSWTAMLVAYVQCGQAAKALQLYAELLEQGESPDAWICATVLQACGMLAEKVVRNKLSESLQKGKAIHAHIWTSGYESDLFVGSSLISMYAKCGSIVDAQNVFDSFLQNDIVLWNTMLAGYALQDLSQPALELYARMSEGEVNPDARTFVSVLQACGSLAEKGETLPLLEIMTGADALQKGKAIHSAALRTGNASDVFVSNALVDMYGKCGSIEDAKTVFDGFTERNIVSWNTMLTALLQNGHAERTLKLFEQMLGEGVSPDNRTFISSIQACGILAEEEEIGLTGMELESVEFLQKAKVTHAEAWRRGYESDVFLGSTLISLYGKCGAIVDAEYVFDRVSQDNVVLWNAMLAGYTSQELAEEAFKLYNQMLLEAISPDSFTFVNVLQVCGQLAEKEDSRPVHGQLLRLQSLQKGKAIHAEFSEKCIPSNLFVLNALVGMYGKCGSIVDAERIFGELSQRDMVSWNIVLSAYVQQGEAEKAVQVYAQMLQEGVIPDDWTFVSVLQACDMLGGKDEGLIQDGLSKRSGYLQRVRAVHSEAWRNGYISDAFVASMLISSYGKSGNIEDARIVLEAFSKRDVVPWNAMLTVYAQHDQGDKVLQVYERMQEEGMTLSETTILCILQACSNTGNLDICNQICDNFVSTRKVFNHLVGSTLVHTYGKCARMEDAQKIFDALPQHDVVSWNALLAGYARQGNYEAAELCYKDMVQAGVMPDQITFLSLISACSHAGMVHKGLEYFEVMSRDYGVLPEIQHYVGMVDMLGRAGCFMMSEGLLSKIPMRPNQSLWLCLLSACRKHGNVVVGERAFACAVQLQPAHAAAYVVMSNIYAHAGMFDAAKMVDEMRQKAGAARKLGQSWIEHQHDVRAFTVSGCQDRQQEQFDYLLEKLSVK